LAENKYVPVVFAFVPTLLDAFFLCCVLDKYVRGVYAITVKGRIPEDVEQDLDSQGVKYRPRDQTEVD
jgi:hypothetical protein